MDETTDKLNYKKSVFKKRSNTSSAITVRERKDDRVVDNLVRTSHAPACFPKQHGGLASATSMAAAAAAAIPGDSGGASAGDSPLTTARASPAGSLASKRHHLLLQQQASSSAGSLGGLTSAPARKVSRIQRGEQALSSSQ